MVTRGFFGKKENNDRVPPGQYIENRFPVLSAEPTPKIELENWNLTIFKNDEELAKIDWKFLENLEKSEITKISIVKKYLFISFVSKLILEKTNLFINTFFGRLKERI